MSGQHFTEKPYTAPGHVVMARTARKPYTAPGHVVMARTAHRFLDDIKAALVEAEMPADDAYAETIADLCDGTGSSVHEAVWRLRSCLAAFQPPPSRQEPTT